MKNLIAATAITILSLTTIAYADNLQHHAGYVANEIYMAAGPGPEFPAITKLNKNDAVDVHGCLINWTWCDVTVHSHHGWLIGQAIYLNDLGPIATFGQNAGVQLTVFDQPIYWNSYYRSEPFYNNGQYNGYNGGHGNAPSQPTMPQIPITTVPSTNTKQQPLSKLGQISQDKQNEISNKLTGTMNK